MEGIQMGVRQRPPVHDLFTVRAALCPDQIAVMSGGRQISYAGLDERANQLAHQLSERGAGRGSVVMVHLERSIETIIALLATLKVGAAYLPVEPDVPDGRISTFLKETGCTTVITDERDRDRFSRIPVTVVTPGSGGHPSVAPEITVDAGDAAYVIYTSGSTGVPKGVVVGHDSLSHLCGELTKRYGLGPDDRVLQFAALSFDTSIEQIMVTLLAGATLVLPDTSWAPSELAGRLERYGVTVMDLTPAYWRSFLSDLEAAPAELPVRLVIVGGEAVRAEDCRRALRLMPGVRLLNAYGLTETTITSCTMELTEEVLPDRGAAPVGRPLPGVEMYVLDERMQPAGPGQRGEVCIGGRGVALGYVAENPANQSRFVPDPFAGRPGARLYRTGDLGAWTPEGNLEIVGRNDRQIKIRGFRVEPDEIAASLAAHKSVGDAAVKAHDRDGQPRLTAYYTVPRRDTQLTATELRKFLAGYLPTYMLPSAYVELPELTLKPNGKVDLDALPEPAAGAAATPGSAPLLGPLEAGLERLWRQVLEVDRVVGPDDDFFELGGNSIHAAEVLARTRASFGILITEVRPLIRRLLEERTLRNFTHAVQAARAGTLRNADTRKLVDFEAEAELDLPIQRAVADPPDWRDPAHILLTGATGFLGIYLLRELLSRTDATVHCLVRAEDADRALARIEANARHYFNNDLSAYHSAGRVVPVAGDLDQPLLGLPEADFDALAGRIDVIHHPGGLVNFLYPYSHMRPANVSGTREIIRMAGRYRNIPVHYISTMAVIAGFGTAGQRHVTEQTPAAHADHLSVGYVESKWVAEAMLRNASRQGLPVAIYRAADISGDRDTGAWSTATEMCAMKRFVVDTGTAPIAELPLDYTPVDRYAAAVAHIASRARPAGEVYHLTNPRKAYVSDLAGRLRTHGYDIREVSWNDWVDRLVETAVEQPGHPMTPFAPLFIDRCATGEMSVAEMYLETTFPDFTRTNVEAALEGSGIEIPAVDNDMLDRYIRYLISIDFLPAP